MLKPVVLFIPHFCLLVFGILVTLVACFVSVFFHLGHLALRYVNKDYVIFSYLCNLVAKSDQNQKTKNGMNETLMVENIFWTHKNVFLPPPPSKSKNKKVTSFYHISPCIYARACHFFCDRLTERII